MVDFFEIDFLDVEAKKSGDAIALRYQVAGKTFLHVVDGGFLDTGDRLIDHINKHYGAPKKIDHVVVTHNDGDHSAGLRKILEAFEIGALWMLRPWEYSQELLPRFARFTNVDNLRYRLREAYGNLVELESIAQSRGIRINEAFQGARIGAFTVLAPSRTRYLNLVVESLKTPEAASNMPTAAATLREIARAPLRFFKSFWGHENFPEEGTSAENEMSLVQYANIASKKILLTGDAGRGTLQEAINYSPVAGLILPGIDRFQVPHHGSRRNVSTELLDQLLGCRLPNQGSPHFSAIISSAKADEDHPRKAVVRAMIHRGAAVVTTEGKSVRSSKNAPDRGWHPLTPEPYPDEQEE